MVRDWLFMTRATNLPTVATNVMVGMALAGASGADPESWILPALGCGLLYCFGASLNDAVDADRDQRVAPMRPIPAGRVRRSTVLGVSIVGLLAGFGLVAAGGAWLPGLLLLMAIVGYDLLHHRLPVATILMGVCRGLVPVTMATVLWPDDAASVWSDGAVLTCAIGMASMIVVLTAIARREHGSRPVPRSLASVVTLAPLAAVGTLLAMRGVPDGMALGVGIIGLLFFVAVHARAMRAGAQSPPAVRVMVMQWLASIALVDALFLAILGSSTMALVALGLYALTDAAHRRVAGT